MKLSRKSTAALAGLSVGGALAVRSLCRYAWICRKNRSIRGRPKIVILGAGFGGLTAARSLARMLPAPENGQITLVDRNNFLQFTPMLTEVAGGELDARHIVASPRQLSQRIEFEQGRVHDIDLENRSVVLSVGSGNNGRRTLKADHLVIALGSAPNYHHIPGLREHSLGIKSIADAAAIRDRVLASLERANWEKDAAVRRELLTFAVGGGGYTGVETIAAVNDLAQSACRLYDRIHREDIRSIVVEPGERLLAELSPDLASFAQGELEKRGVQVRLKTKIRRVDEDEIELDGGERIRARTLIWAGGVTPNPIAANLNCRRSKHGAIAVDRTLAVPDHPGIWALGDCAAVPQGNPDKTYAPTAQNATREGELVASNIVASLRGDDIQEFTFTPIGELALVGRHSGVGKVYGRRFSGFPAWVMWRAVYLAKMPGWAQKSRTAADWILDAIFGRNIAEIPAESAQKRAPTPAHAENT